MCSLRRSLNARRLSRVVATPRRDTPDALLLLKLLSVSAMLPRAQDYCSLLAAACARRVDPETALAIHLFCARRGWCCQHDNDSVLRTRLWHMQLNNPIGLAAGFDKDAKAACGLLRGGFGLVEVGSVTPAAQLGNARPRIFRLAEDAALINRYNPSAGQTAVFANLFDQKATPAPSDLPPPGNDFLMGAGPIGVNLGTTAPSSPMQAEGEFIAGIRSLGPLADYLCVNISYPKAADAFQASALGEEELRGEALRLMLRRLRAEVDALRPASASSSASSAGTASTASIASQPSLRPPPPLVLKVSPDLGNAQRAEVAAAALAEGIDGIVVANASLSRPKSLHCTPSTASEAGGLSGAPLREASVELLSDLYKRTSGRVPLIGVGGVSSGRDAYLRIRAGASAVQLYTAFAHEGWPLLPRIKAELAALLKADGYASVADAVGADHR